MNAENEIIPLVSVVIPNLNGMKYLPACLSSIQGQTYRGYEVIIVDNGSTDESVDFIKSGFPRTMVIENKQNMGFAEANNQGISAARGKYIATLNNDTEADKDWLRTLVTEAEHSDDDVGMWAPKILALQNKREIDSVGGLLIYRDGIAKGRGRLETDNGQYDNIKEILCPSACCALYRNKMLDDIGHFDSDFFAYCEDNDLGLRARRAGWKALSVPASIVYHYYSGTGGTYSHTKAFLVERNHLWVAWKNFPVTWNMALPFYVLLRYVMQFYGTLSGKGSAAKFVESYRAKDVMVIVIKAYLAALKGLPLILRKRRLVRRRISQREFTGILRTHAISAKALALMD